MAKGKRLQNNDMADWARSFDNNSDEAWEQVKAFSKKPLRWLVIVLALLALVGVCFAARFFSTVRAPELVPEKTVTVETPRHTVDDTEPPEEVDVSNTVQPLLSGARKENFYTFLLFGTDKEGTNTDTIMVVSYDVANQKLNLMSIPRDTMVNVGWDIKKINSVFGVRGLDGFKKHIAKLIGFTPDFYVKIDLQAFVDVVDLIGGVEFNVPIPMHYHDPYQNLSIDLDPGVQTLNGEQAMGLVRFRKSDRGTNGRVTGYDDTGRVQTQQAFLREMFKKCVKLTNWTKISGYVEIFERNVESDLTLGNMLWFARQAMELGEDGFFTVTAPGNYYASAYSRSTGSMQSYVTLYGREMVKLVNESFNPYLTQVSLSNMDIMGVRSDGSVYSSTGYVADSRAALPVVREAEKAEEKAEKQEAEDEPTEEPEVNAEAPEGAGGEEPIESRKPTEGEDPNAGGEGLTEGEDPNAEGEEPTEGEDPNAEGEEPTRIEPPTGGEPTMEDEPPVEFAPEQDPENSPTEVEPEPIPTEPEMPVGIVEPMPTDTTPVENGAQ